MAFATGEQPLPNLSRLPGRRVSPQVPGSPGAASPLRANRHPAVCHPVIPPLFLRSLRRLDILGGTTIRTGPFAFRYTLS